MIAANKKILVIDDEPDFCSFLQSNLQETAGYHVSVASSGEEGLALAKQTLPHLILLDLVLPGIDGMEVLRRLRKDPATKNLAVLIISIKKDLKARQDGRSLAIRGYLEKPIQIKDLLDGIQSALNNPRKSLLQKLVLAPRKTRILVIDDEEDFAGFVKSNLEETGNYQVKVATAPNKGLRMAQEWRPDLVLLDIIMPEMDGLELLRRLKEGDSTRSISVLMLSARTDDKAKRESTRHYIEGYVEKPVQLNVLQSRIEKVLSRFGKSGS